MVADITVESGHGRDFMMQGIKSLHNRSCFWRHQAVQDRQNVSIGLRISGRSGCSGETVHPVVN